LAFNLLAEFEGTCDWGALLAALGPVPAGIECFPIPAGTGGEPDALGISLLLGADERTWAGFVGLAGRLWARGGVRLYELYTGTEVTPDSLPVLQRLVLG
jgi:hypothetical protein